MTPFERGLLVPDGNTCALLDRKLRLPYHQPFCNTTHRLEPPRKAYEALGYQVDYPLMWKPWELRPYQDVIREEWGIEPPRLYAMGFPHNNCGGRCIKYRSQGIISSPSHSVSLLAFSASS